VASENPEIDCGSFESISDKDLMHSTGKIGFLKISKSVAQTFNGPTNLIYRAPKALDGPGQRSLTGALIGSLQHRQM